jgi:elongation factor P--beta-lysine ligase
MDQPLLDLLTETVSHQNYLSQDGYGAPVYGPVVLRPCKVEFKVGPMVTSQGEERTSSTRIFFDTDFELKLRDRITLADGTAPQIQMVYRPNDEYGQVHHQECLF